MQGRRVSVLLFWHRCELHKIVTKVVTLMALEAETHVQTPRMKQMLTGIKEGAQSQVVVEHETSIRHLH